MAIRTELANAAPLSANASRREDDAEGLDVFAILDRQKWLIAFFAAAGLTIGVLYALNAKVWFRTEAKVLINQKTAGLTTDSEATNLVAEGTLANHIELLQSRLIVGEALHENGLTELPSVVAELEGNQDAIDYVISRLELVKGGDGSAQSARTLNISLTHSDPADAKLLLTAVLKRYEQFILEQIEELMGRAGEMVRQARDEVEKDLLKAEAEYLAARQEAPLFFAGEGSSNVYQDRYRRLQDEMLDIDIQESTLRTRLEGVKETLAEMETSDNPMDNLDKLALIDSESLERLGVFARLQMDAGNTAEFKARMPTVQEKARAEITRLMELNSELQRLSAIFGPGNPRIQDINREIETTKKFLAENNQTVPTEGFLGSDMLTPSDLLKAYIGFLEHDLVALFERRAELEVLAKDSEKKAKELIEYELRDLVLQKKIRRQESLFDGIVTQLQEMDTVNGLGGYLYEFLDIPRLGKQSWPNLPLCGLGGLMLGMFGGLVLALANEIRDGRFRSAAELDEVIDMPNLGLAGKLNSMRQGVIGLESIQDTAASEVFRLGRTLLLPEIRAGRLKTIGFTSPKQGDGKSTFCSNFASSLAQLGLKVLIIDGDLRRPSIDQYFSMPKGIGVFDVLVDQAQWQDAIRETEIENISVMTSGTSSRKPSELLQSDRLDWLLDQVKEAYDIVLFDLPPVLAVSDPVVVLPRLDGGVLVVRASTVRRDELLNTMKRVETSGGKWIGCFLNAYGATGKFDVEGGYYGYYQSDYAKSGSLNGAARPVRSRAATIKVPTE
ncbi:MAG: polysaccharide biosynthesis tyrosine autokinase [Planctomycetota bacterium]